MTWYFIKAYIHGQYHNNINKSDCLLIPLYSKKKKLAAYLSYTPLFFYSLPDNMEDPFYRIRLYSDATTRNTCIRDIRDGVYRDSPKLHPSSLHLRSGLFLFSIWTIILLIIITVSKICYINVRIKCRCKCKYWYKIILARCLQHLRFSKALTR